MRSRRRPGSLWRFGRPPLIERLTRRSDLSSPSSLPPPESRAIPVEMKQDPIANQGVSNAFSTSLHVLDAAFRLGNRQPFRAQPLQVEHDRLADPTLHF